MTKLRNLSGPLLFAALCGAVTMGACSLNPQPIPPGEQPDGGDKFGNVASDAGTTPTSGTDSGGGNTFQDLDAEAGSDAADDASDDAGDADTDAHDS